MGDRADRLSSRRKDRSSNESADEEKPEQLEKPEKQDKPESAKDSYQGTYIYLPEDLRQEFDLVADEMHIQRQRRNGKAVEKIRHFEPLIVALGLEAVESLDEDEIENRLSEFDP